MATMAAIRQKIVDLVKAGDSSIEGHARNQAKLSSSRTSVVVENKGQQRNHRTPAGDVDLELHLRAFVPFKGDPDRAEDEIDLLMSPTGPRSLSTHIEADRDLGDLIDQQSLVVRSVTEVEMTALASQEYVTAALVITCSATNLGTA